MNSENDKDHGKTNKADAELAFLVKVGGVEGEARAYEFDRERVVVGRGADVDLNVAHAAMSRHQFAIERIVQLQGPPRFRIVPLGGCNPTHVNGQPAVEGSLSPGDQIAVGPLRISIERSRRKPDATAASSRRNLFIGVGVVLLLAYMMLPDGSAAKPAAKAQGVDISAPLFQPLPPLSCATMDACAGRARERYSKGRQYEELAVNNPGNWYLAAIEFAYAAQLRNASRTALPEIADAGERVDRAARKAQQMLDDARFELQAASNNKNGYAIMLALAKIEQIVPDPAHPIRVAITGVRTEMLKKGKKK